VLEVQGLGKDYGETRAVRDLAFRVQAGEIYGLVGPNGAGKTTTLRMLSGVMPIQEGTVRIAGHDLEREERRAKRAMAWVPEDPAPFDSLTVWEHLEFTASLYKVRPWSERAEELLEHFSLTEKREALGGELSRGMRQKLAFCCAWLSRPRVLLLDEPLSGLDPRGIRDAKQAIRDLAADGTAVLLSSHLLDLIEELCGRILILARGRSVFQGTLAEARSNLIGSENSTLEEIFLTITDASERRSEASR